RKAVPSRAAPQSVAPAARRNNVDIGALVNSHLFGVAPGNGASGRDAANAPATSMSLVLAGVLAAEDPLKGVAIVGEAAASARVYTVGQSVPGGAKLHAVYVDRVILDRNGALESLLLPRQSAPGAGAAAPLSPTAMAPLQNPMLERMRQMIRDDPSVIGGIIRPVFHIGKQKGFLAYPGRDFRAFARLGLRPGDLVTAVNGTPLDDPNRGNEILRTLGSSTDARVTVVRNGRQQELTLNLAQVVTETQQAMDSAGDTMLERQAPTSAPTEISE
ncbi:MAG: type II secretion system protein GspC, partial [Steroidobacteraceae bacterium]